MIARADTSIAHLLGYHYAIGQNLALFGEHEQVLEWSTESLRERWFWAAVDNPLDADLVARWDGGRLLISGSKNFATGALLADRVMLSATLEGKRLVAVIPAGRKGFTPVDDWENVGQRATASGSVVLNDVEIAPSEVLGAPVPAGKPLSPFATLVAPITQIVLVNVFLGAAQGALADGLEYTRTRSRAWPASGVQSPAQDPYILAHYGELAADLDASLALADSAAVTLQNAIGLGPALTSQERAEAAIRVYAAKVHSTRVSLEVASKVFELMGARATATRFSFDRRWRDIRTLTLHDPVAYKAREVGEYALTGRGPEFSLYS
jgi:alkylation response protein AidB-like acyl-CoA dehydrogenase